MSFKTIVASLALGYLFLSPPFAFAAGIQVSPAKLEFDVRGGQSSSQQLLVVNPTADVQIFKVYADNFTDAVKALPESFTLESGGRKIVTVTVIASALYQADAKLSTSLSVVGKPLADDKLSVGTGVKLPLTVTISQTAKKPENNKWLTAGLAVIILAALAYRFKKPKI